MGAKTWMIVYSTTSARAELSKIPELDRDATLRLVAHRFPGTKLIEIGVGDLSYTSPPDDEVYAGSFAGVSVIAAAEFGLDCPSRLKPSFVAKEGFTYLHAMHSVVDWFAYAVWSDGKLQRSLSLSPDSGVMEDIGQRLPFEEPFWAGEYPAGDPEDDEDDYPFPFHPLELGEAALGELFGYHLEGFVNDLHFDAENIAMLQFKRSRPWWKLW